MIQSDAVVYTRDDRFHTILKRKLGPRTIQGDRANPVGPYHMHRERINTRGTHDINNA